MIKHDTSNMIRKSGLRVLALVALIVPTQAAARCSSANLALPRFDNFEVLDVHATARTQWDGYSERPELPPLNAERGPLDFCNVSVTYTHPGLQDIIHVTVWLPLSDATWNQRFLGQGGGGYVAGTPGALAGPVAKGFAAAQTDAGHDAYGQGDPMKAAWSSRWWAWTNDDSEVDLVALENFASRAYDEMMTIGKAVVHAYYARPPTYAYWNGCSTGGRQGLMLAQRYPSAYDGILAACPAINWASFILAELWPQIVMHEQGYFPPADELNAITAAAIQACDALDAVEDGIIAAPGLCHFDALSVVGKEYECEGETRTISEEAAIVANAAWEGPVKDGQSVWFGVNHEAALAGPAWGVLTLAATNCDASNRDCSSSPFPMPQDWIRHFLNHDDNLDVSSVTRDGLISLIHENRRRYGPVIDTADPDLRKMQEAGGKILSWHGLADTVIPPNGTSHYYERVEKISPDVRDFYRHFEAPGVAHCLFGPGAFPLRALDVLMRWVEDGIAPDSLPTETHPLEDGQTVKTARLCPYPQVAVLIGDDPNRAESYACADSFEELPPRHDEL